MLIGLAVAPNKEIAFEALTSTLASILIYYDIVSNRAAGNKYWLGVVGIIYVLTISMSIWFFSQGNGRQFFFNRWAFKLFEGLSVNSNPPLSWNSVGALLIVVIRKTKSIVTIRPKPPFNPIFQVAVTKEGSDIRIINEPLNGTSVFLVETGENLIIPDTILELLSKQFGQIRKTDHIEVQLRLFDCNVDTMRSSVIPETRELCFV